MSITEMADRIRAILDGSNEEAAQFAMSGLDETFASRVKPGDIFVAGANFGSGSGRENAPAALQGAGIACVIAPSFARLFYRNLINRGLPPGVIPRVAAIEAGDWLTVDLAQRRVVIERTGEALAIDNLTGTSRAILEAGGIVEFTKRRRGPVGPQ